MKRDANLVPLSRQHFRALVLCMRIHRKRAPRSILQREMLELYAEDVRFHFQAEEEYLFPAARRLAVAAPLVRELLGEHKKLRRAFAAARRRTLKSEEMVRFADLLEGHIRKEERQLFQECQKQMSEKELDDIGKRMGKYFQKCGAAAQAACKLPAR
ncbi:MAG TPA: hemerythrin domain-containing protein [Terriglobales bacterium]|nr:hemerythrin domain-containing protein [Terriglobales bacterium]